MTTTGQFDVETSWELLLALTRAGQSLEQAHEVLRVARGGSGEHTACVRILYESCLALIHETWQAFLRFRESDDPETRRFVETMLEAARVAAQESTPARKRETVPPDDEDSPARADDEDPS